MQNGTHLEGTLWYCLHQWKASLRQRRARLPRESKTYECKHALDYAIMVDKKENDYRTTTLKRIRTCNCHHTHDTFKTYAYA